MKRYLIVLAVLSLAFIATDKPEKKYFRYGKTIENSFVNNDGNLNGKFERTYDEHVVETGTYADGKKTGTWTSTSVQGRVVKQLSYKNDVPDGKVNLYFADGKPRVTGAFDNGLKDGAWTYYNSKNKVIKTGIYSKGVPKGAWFFYDEDGKSVIEKYDFDQQKELVDNRAALHYSDDEIKFQSDYMDKSYRYREVIDVPAPGARPLGGYRKTKELFAKNFEIPQDIWFTYVSQTYFATYKISAAGSFGDVTVTRVKKSNMRYKTGMDFYFFTEYDNHLQRVNIDERTLYHFADKIKEDFELFYGPWIMDTHENVNGFVQMNFVVNQQ
jgi:hypothetical protein